MRSRRWVPFSSARVLPSAASTRVVAGRASNPAVPGARGDSSVATARDTIPAVPARVSGRARSTPSTTSDHVLTASALRHECGLGSHRRATLSVRGRRSLGTITLRDF